MPLSTRIKEVATEEASSLQQSLSQAATSGTYLYPIHGILYFTSHPSLWRPLTSRLLPILSLAVAVTVGMFVFTYLPQLAIMAFVDGPLAPVTTVLLVLSESSAVVNFVSKGFVLQDALVDTFDAVLVGKGCERVLESGGREVKRGKGDFMSKLGKSMTKPFQRLTPSAIIRYFLYLPLNFIPIVGNIIFITLQGRRYGPASHERYFQLKKWSAGARGDWVERHQAAYTSFGVPATLLEMMPVAGLFFVFTNTCGAALWAADMEKGIGSTAPELRRAAGSAQGT